MKKLIELLNEYEEEKAKYWNQYCNWQYIWGRPICTTSYDMNRIVQFSDLLIISKMYEFIKWLVDNDKIDLEKLDEKAERKPQYTFIDDDWRLWFKLFEVYESLLMLLAIQENPIEFLCSVLN